MQTGAETILDGKTSVRVAFAEPLLAARVLCALPPTGGGAHFVWPSEINQHGFVLNGISDGGAIALWCAVSTDVAPAV